MGKGKTQIKYAFRSVKVEEKKTDLWVAIPWDPKVSIQESNTGNFISSHIVP